MVKILNLSEYQKSKEAELLAMARLLPAGFFEEATDDVIERQTKDLSKYNMRKVFGNLLSGNIGDDKCLLEGITRSFPLAAVKKHIEKHYKPSVGYKALPEHVKELLGSTIWTLRIFEAPVNAYNSVVSYYDLESWQFVIQNNDDGTQTHAMVILPDIFDNVLMMDETMVCFGYYRSCKLPVSKVFPKIKNMNNWCVLQYEQRVQDFVNEKIREEKYLYHISPTVVEKKILKTGLVPKSKNAVFDYPERVYLLKGSEKDISYGLGGVASLLFQNSGKSGNEKIENYTVYRIDVSKLPENINFQLEYNFQPASVFTADNIPPYALKVFARIEIGNQTYNN